MAFKMIGDGNLAGQPELQRLNGGYQKVVFTLLSSRMVRGTQVTESARFVLWGDEAERFCETVIKGQEISVMAVQETYRYTDRDTQQKRELVQFNVNWWQAGRKPQSYYQNQQAASSDHRSPSRYEAGERQQQRPNAQPSRQGGRAGQANPSGHDDQGRYDRPSDLSGHSGPDGYEQGASEDAPEFF